MDQMSSGDSSSDSNSSSSSSSDDSSSDDEGGQRRSSPPHAPALAPAVPAIPSPTLHSMPVLITGNPPVGAPLPPSRPEESGGGGVHINTLSELVPPLSRFCLGAGRSSEVVRLSQGVLKYTAHIDRRCKYVSYVFFLDQKQYKVYFSQPISMRCLYSRGFDLNGVKHLCISFILNR